MKKIEVYNKSTLSFFGLVKSSKRNPKDDSTYLLRLEQLAIQIKNHYDLFDEKFNFNSLISLPDTVFKGQDKNDLISMYKYDLKCFQKLKEYLLTDEHNRINNKCLNCTFGEVNSFDHFMPKDAYPEFSVNPKNLIPSCAKCNSKKSVYWKNETSTLFINHYLDSIPNIQYLFCNIRKTSNSFEVFFYVENKNSIPQEIFSKIANHYDKLDLCLRFSTNCSEDIIELQNSFFSHLDLSENNTIENFVEYTSKKLLRDESSFGINNWTIVLKKALINSSIFLDFIKESYSPIKF